MVELSDSGLVLVGMVGLLILLIATGLVLYFTNSFVLMTITSFFISEAMFVIIAMNSQGLFLWFVVAVLIPGFHFGNLVLYTHSCWGKVG